MYNAFKYKYYNTNNTFMFKFYFLKYKLLTFSLKLRLFIFHARRKHPKKIIFKYSGRSQFIPLLDTQFIDKKVMGCK